MPAPVPETDAEVRRRVLQQLLADAVSRGDTTGVVAPEQQQIIEGVRMGSNEDAAWAGHYRNDEVNKSQQQMLNQVAEAMIARRAQTAADKLLLEGGQGGGGGGGGRGRRSGGGGSSTPLAAPLAPTQPVLRGRIDLAPAMPAFPTVKPLPGSTPTIKGSTAVQPWMVPGWETAQKKKPAAPPPRAKRGAY